MHLYLLSMRDIKASIYLQPFATHNLASFYRDMGDLLLQQGNGLPFVKYPNDFEIYQLGTFDDQTGEITPMKPKFLKHLIELKDTTNG